MESQCQKYQNNCLNLERELHNRAVDMEGFIRRVNEEESIRIQSYEAQIVSLKALVSQGEEKLRAMQFQHEQQMADSNRRQLEMQSNLAKHSFKAE